MQGAKLVAGGIAQVSEIEAAALSHARWVFAGCAPGRKPGRVPGIGRFRARSREADGPTVGAGGGLAVERKGDAEDAIFGAIEKMRPLGSMTPGSTPRAPRVAS